jgi:hypothetical protein
MKLAELFIDLAGGPTRRNIFQHDCHPHQQGQRKGVEAEQLLCGCEWLDTYIFPSSGEATIIELYHGR